MCSVQGSESADNRPATWTSTAGPRQTNAVKKALADFRWRGLTHRELTDHGSHVLTEPFGTPSQAFEAAYQALGERFGWRITRENAAEVERAAREATTALEIPTVDHRTTPEQREQQAKERAEAEVRQAKAAEEFNATKAAEVERLRAAYPWALPWDAKDARGRPMSHHARAAANMREELRRTFPGVHFKVTSESFSGGDAIDVHWELGPTTAQVQEVTGKYLEGSFNGMIDMYEDDYSAVRSAVADVLGSIKYCSPSRHAPDDVTEQVCRLLCEAQHVEYQGPNTQRVWGEHDAETVSQHAWRLLSDTSFPVGAVIKGVEWNDEDGRNGYRIVFEVPERPAVPEASGNGHHATVGKYHHTKRGFDFWLVTLAERVEREDFERIRAACEQAGGWYSRKWGRTPGGFAFESEQAAQAFAATV